MCRSGQFRDGEENRRKQNEIVLRLGFASSGVDPRQWKSLIRKRRIFTTRSPRPQPKSLLRINELTIPKLRNNYNQNTNSKIRNTIPQNMIYLLQNYEILLRICEITIRFEYTKQLFVTHVTLRTPYYCHSTVWFVSFLFHFLSNIS